MARPEFHERDILTRFALRFDGHKYASAFGLDARRALADFFATGQWALSPNEKQALFFLLQRDLCHWALTHEPLHGKYWRAFRALFLEVAALEVPAEFRMPHRYERWENEYAARIPACVAHVRGIHASIPYDDCAQP